ncbi:MAG: HAMP domain-containing protein [Chloroflexi bacterium]|nr:HAMP domain-containing protein [Chloroflexota bacterium]
MGRFKHIGIQTRFTLYAAVGLALLFVWFSFFGLRSVRQATELVYEERLSTVHATANLLDDDFRSVAEDVHEFREELMAPAGPDADSATRRLLVHFSENSLSQFFLVNGVSLLDARGQILAEAGARLADRDRVNKAVTAKASPTPGDRYVLSEMTLPGGGVPLITIAVPVPEFAGPSQRIVAVQAGPKNTAALYDPNPSPTARIGDASPSLPPDARSQYRLEVISPGGIVVLGLGPDTHPGKFSIHFATVASAMSAGKPAVMLHRPPAQGTFGPHVHAAVPVGSSGFYLILEQQEDIALALPLQLQRQLVVQIVLGLAASILVAWAVTRSIVRPVRQLTQSALRMADGNLVTSVDIDAQDEVLDLAQALEAMRQKLMAASQQIEKANRELESKVAERTERLGEVLHRLISAQEEERSRLARDLHDEQSQTLGAISVSLDLLSRSLSNAPSQVREELERARDMAHALLEETRRLIYDLRPSVLDDMGLEAAIRWFAETHLEREGVDVSIQNSLPGKRFPASLEVALYRICQEAMVNIERHSRARHAGVALEQRGSFVQVLVWDDGQGFDAGMIESRQKASPGVGLEGMRERVRLIGGRLEIASQPGGGTTIKVEVPLVQEVKG